MQLLEANRARLDALAGALLEHETLDEDDAYAAAGIDPRECNTAKQREIAAAARTRV